MTKTTAPKRFLSIRLSEAEFKDIQKHFSSSACNSLTEYAKTLLTKKPVVVKNRNQTGDDLLETLINIKNKLTLLEDQLSEKNITQLEKELHDIKSQLCKLHDFAMIIQKSYNKC